MPVRETEIIRYFLRANRPVHAREAAEAFQVSTRYIKTLIAGINDEFLQKNIQIQSNTHKGYWIEQDDKPGFLDYLHQNEKQLVPVDQTQRVIWMSLYALSHDLRLPSLQTLSSKLFVSRSAIAGDIRYIEEICTTAGELHVLPQKKGGYLIIGEEEIIRKYFCILVSIFDKTEREYLKHCIIHFFSAVYLATQLHDQMIFEMEKSGMRINDFSLRLLTYYLLFAFFRIDRGCRLNDFHSSETPSWIDAAEMCIGKTLEPAEKSFLMNYVWKKMIRFSDFDASVSGDRILADFSEYVQAEYSFDILHYPEVRSMMNSFVNYAALVRPDTIPERVRSDHPFAFALANALNRSVCKYTGTTISEDSLDAITAYFSVILNRNAKKIRTVILTEMEFGYKEYLLYRISTRFDHYLDIRGVYPLYAINNKELFTEAYLIICTSRRISTMNSYERMMNIINKDILFINPRFEYQDVRIIEHYIHDYLPSRSGNVKIISA